MGNYGKYIVLALKTWQCLNMILKLACHRTHFSRSKRTSNERNDDGIFALQIQKYLNSFCKEHFRQEPEQIFFSGALFQFSRFAVVI